MNNAHLQSSLPTLHINLDNLAYNYKVIKALNPSSTLSAVIKSDSYGIGALEVVKTLYDIGCRDFWVAHAEEGKKIFDGFDKKDISIYVLHGLGQSCISIFKEYKNLFPVLNSPAQIQFWKQTKPNNNPVLLHLDTGLSRLGLRDFELDEILKNKELDGLEIKMIISHLACGEDKDHPMNKIQLDNFKAMTKKLPKAPLSLSASSGAYLGKDYAFDMIRSGASLYGINTAPYQQSIVKPVVFVSAPILQKTKMKSGAIAGYGATYTAESDRDLAILSIGYADGFPKRIGKALGGNQGYVFAYDEKQKKYYDAPILGSVSMDTLICDVTGIPEHLIQEGCFLEVLNTKYQAENLAKDAGTIDYEILTRLGRRFIKTYS